MSQENRPRPSSSSSSSSSSSRENVHRKGGGGEEKAMAGPVARSVRESYSAMNPTASYRVIAAIYRHLGIPKSSTDDDSGGGGDRNLALKDSAFALVLDSPQKRQFKEHSMSGDDPLRKKIMESVKSAHGDDDAENPRNEDEVTILQGILGYYSKNGTYPFSDLIDFHSSLENSLQANASASQLMHRIEGMREKYDKIVEENGMKKMNLLNAQDQEVFELSKNIWGDDGAENVNDEQRKNVEVGEEQDLSVYPFLKESLQFLTGSGVPFPVLGESLAKEGLSLMGNSKVKELDEQCRKLKVEEARFYLKRVELIRDQTKLILDAVESSSLINCSKTHKRRTVSSSSTPGSPLQGSDITKRSV